ncbi:hypothetical protein [Fictibacillus phosphorivorans]|uniref:hypothetical protein n=1 Tax=Fictibacillus phosphorivorans TaxID=1221500 RepID=UPI0011AABC9D|nr:hypothetical protein [Fictibacillus phosphorivorans]
MVKTLKVLLLTFLFNGILFLGLPYAYLAYQGSKFTFSVEKWHAQEDKRGDIVEDLVEKYDFKGWSDTRVIKLLGEPVKDGARKEPDNIVYYLGDESGYPSIDSEWLLFWFDENDRVTKFEVTTD